jgi:hypothetical protein
LKMTDIAFLYRTDQVDVVCADEVSKPSRRMRWTVDPAADWSRQNLRIDIFREWPTSHGFRIRSGILATSESWTPPHASRQWSEHLINCRLSAWATA